MKVLVVSQYYPPEAVPIPADIARELAERGHAVRVLTGYPNYPAGKVFPGYRQKWRGRERDSDVDVHRVPLYANHSQTAVKRLLNYVSFAVSATTARRLSRGADVIYVYATQMTAATGPWLWRLIGGAPYVLHIQDLWPDSVLGSSMVASGRASRTIAGILRPWLSSVYRRAGAVIGIAPTMVTTLKERGVAPDKAHLVYNWADADSTLPLRSPAVRTAGTTVVYAGNIGEMQDLETAVRAAHAAADTGLSLVIVGDGTMRAGLRALVAELECTNVTFEDPIPREMMAGVYERADFGLVPLKDLPVFRGTIPSKLQAVLAAGVPVITTVQGDVRSFVRERNVGLTADAEDVTALEKVFREAAALDSASRGLLAMEARALYIESFSRAAGISSVEAILTAAADGTKGKK